MNLNEVIIFAGILYCVQGEILNIERDVKYVVSNFLGNISESDTISSRSFLECIKICYTADKCSSLFYIYRVCVLVRDKVEFSSASCFGVEGEATLAFVGLNTGSWEILQPTNSTCQIQIVLPDPCLANITLYCGSSNMQYSNCIVSGASLINTVTVQQQQSTAACTYNVSFGFTANLIWVDAGCRADFLVCYTPVT